MTLKRELESSSSPLRATLESMLPDLGRHARVAWKAQMNGAVASFNPDLPHTPLGHAINERIAWQFAGVASPFPGQLFLMMCGADADVLDELAAEMAGPCPGVDPDREARVACLVGLADQAYRIRRVEDSWYESLFGARTLDEALAAVDPAWVDDVISTTEASLSALAPLAGKARVVRGPSFVGSSAVGGADADLILGGSLVEVKAVRASALSKLNLQQVVSYALLDWVDDYSLDEVALLSARHGVLVRWPLEDLVAAGSRGEYDLAGARARLLEALAAALAE